MGGEKEDFFEEEFQEGDEQEAQEEESAVEEEEKPISSSRLQSLEEKIDRLFAMNAGKQNENNTTVETRPQLTKEQMEAIAKDPSLLIGIMENHTKNITQQVQGQLQQSHWDQKAYKDYPGLNNDKKFEGLVTKEIQQLVATGAMAKDHPQLLYHAARLASANYKPAANGGNSKTVKSKNALAPGARSSSKEQSHDGDVSRTPEYQMYKMAGWPEEKIKKAMANAKRRERDIQTRTDPTTGRTRRVILLDRRR